MVQYSVFASVFKIFGVRFKMTICKTKKVSTRKVIKEKVATSRTFMQLPWWWDQAWHVERRKILKLFCRKFNRIIDVGCGSYELLSLGDAGGSVGIDLCLSALKDNKKVGFKGDLVQAECRFLPFRGKCFDGAICSEVIEHLDSLESVRRAIWELKRVAHSVIITTPNCVFGFKWRDPGHKLFLTSKSLKKVLDADFELYTSNVPPDKVIHNYLPYESPKLQSFPLIGKHIVRLLMRIDQSFLAKNVVKKLWKGAYLVAIWKSDTLDS